MEKMLDKITVAVLLIYFVFSLAYPVESQNSWGEWQVWTGTIEEFFQSGDRVGVQVEDEFGTRYLVGDIESDGSFGGIDQSNIVYVTRYRRLLPEELVLNK